MTKHRRHSTKVRAEGWIQYGIGFVFLCYRKSLLAETLILTYVGMDSETLYIIMALSQFSDNKLIKSNFFIRILKSYPFKQ